MDKRMTAWLSAFALLSLLLALTSSPSEAEVYVAGQAGVSIPHSLSNVEYRGSTFDGNDLSLNKSLVYGAKLGYYFDSLKRLGLETEVFNALPDIQRQNLILAGTNLGTIGRQDLRILTWVPVNIVVRYQAGSFEPYAGVGLGVFFSRLSSGGFSSSSTDVGLNTQLGLRYRVTDNVALFGEWKFNRANVTLRNLSGNGLNLSADYNAHTFVFGVGYHSRSLPM
jgi:opacity protein-like surface antigen